MEGEGAAPRTPMPGRTQGGWDPGSAVCISRSLQGVIFDAFQLRRVGACTASVRVAVVLSQIRDARRRSHLDQTGITPVSNRPVQMAKR
jgi:hypothetical protein